MKDVQCKGAEVLIQSGSVDLGPHVNLKDEELK